MPDQRLYHTHRLTCPFGCSPGLLDMRDDEPAVITESIAAAVVDPRDEIGQRVPEILLQTTHAWRRTCLAEVSHIPAGYTYLGQLMGHDIGNSITVDAVPHVIRGNAIGAGARLGPQRYNLIDNPLTLETVYGPGPMMLSHLYDPNTMLFRLTPGARLARTYTRTAGGDSDRILIRALYDERNRDTLMLHELTVAWMQFHNLCARRLLDGGKAPLAAYVAVRSHAVRVWHAILENEVLPRFVHPDIAVLSDAALAAEWHLDETTLLHGLFRAFHAMPLAAYQLGRSGMHNLASMMKLSFEPSEAETDWQIDWSLFFGHRPGTPMTGISASVAPELRAPVTAAAIIALDHRSTSDASPLRSGDAAMAAAIAKLPGQWPQRVMPDAMAREFAQRYPNAPVAPDADVIAWGPLFQMLMIEAQLHGQAGGLGPFGSALLRCSIRESIKRVVHVAESAAVRALPRPNTMLDLINLVRERN